MADPRTIAPDKRKAGVSELMQAKNRASFNERVNRCPFGCADEELDDNGYCDHLVGFTVPGNASKFEPMVMTDRGVRKVIGETLEDVLPSDKIDQITVSARVYRKQPRREAASA